MTSIMTVLLPMGIWTVETMKLSIRNVDIESGTDQHDVFQSLRKESILCIAWSPH
jgi:hypothetical protein